MTRIFSDSCSLARDDRSSRIADTSTGSKNLARLGMRTYCQLIAGAGLLATARMRPTLTGWINAVFAGTDAHQALLAADKRSD